MRISVANFLSTPGPFTNYRYLTLGLLSSLWNIYHSITAYFLIDPVHRWYTAKIKVRANNEVQEVRPSQLRITASSCCCYVFREYPPERLGYGTRGLKNLQKHKWFDGFNWLGLQQRTITAPIIPIVRSHTHTPRLTALFPGLPRWATTRKVKPIWILLKQVTVSGSGISWAICKSAPCSRQTTTQALHHSVFYRPDALPAAQTTASKHWRVARLPYVQCTIIAWHAKITLQIIKFSRSIN